GTASQLKASVGSGALHVRVRDPEQRASAEQVLITSLGVDVAVGSDPNALTARGADPDRVAHALSELTHAGINLTEFALGQPSLDEVFLALTGRPAEPEPGPADDLTEEVVA